MYQYLVRRRVGTQTRGVFLVFYNFLCLKCTVFGSSRGCIDAIIYTCIYTVYMYLPVTLASRTATKFLSIFLQACFGPSPRRYIISVFVTLDCKNYIRFASLDPLQVFYFAPEVLFLLDFNFAAFILSSIPIRFHVLAAEKLLRTMMRPLPRFSLYIALARRSAVLVWRQTYTASVGPLGHKGLIYGALQRRFSLQQSPSSPPPHPDQRPKQPTIQKGSKLCQAFSISTIVKNIVIPGTNKALGVA